LPLTRGSRRGSPRAATTTGTSSSGRRCARGRAGGSGRRDRTRAWCGRRCSSRWVMHRLASCPGRSKPRTAVSTGTRHSSRATHRNPGTTITTITITIIITIISSSGLRKGIRRNNRRLRCTSSPRRTPISRSRRMTRRRHCRSSSFSTHRPPERRQGRRLTPAARVMRRPRSICSSGTSTPRRRLHRYRTRPRRRGTVVLRNNSHSSMRTRQRPAVACSLRRHLATGIRRRRSCRPQDRRRRTRPHQAATPSLVEGYRRLPNRRRRRRRAVNPSRWWHGRATPMTASRSCLLRTYVFLSCRSVSRETAR